MVLFRLLRQALVTALLMLPVCSLSTGVVSAEAPDPIQYQQITPDIIEDFAKAFKMSPDDPALRAIFEETNAELRDNPFGNLDSLRSPSYRQPVAAASDRRSLSISLARMQISAHYRFDAGIPFVAAAPEPVSPAWQAGSHAVSKYFLDLMRDSARRVRETPPLPDCVREDTTRAQLDSGDPEFDQQRQDEFLYLRGKAPVDAKIRFGENVTIIECGGEKGDDCAIASDLTNVRCLPTRIQMKNGRVTRIEGAAALKQQSRSRAPESQR